MDAVNIFDELSIARICFASGEDCCRVYAASKESLAMFTWTSIVFSGVCVNWTIQRRCGDLLPKLLLKVAWWFEYVSVHPDFLREIS